MKRASSGLLLRRLERLRESFGPEAAEGKRRLVRRLDRARFRTADQLLRYHELLCFWRAYPDDRAVLEAVEAALARFERRADLKRFAEALASTGVAGAENRFPCYRVMARWLAERWPDHVELDWEAFENGERLSTFLYLLLSPSESLLLDTYTLAPRRWLELVKPRGQTDAAFVVRRFDRLRTDALGQEILYDDLELPLVLSPGRTTPNRTRARRPKSPVVFRNPPYVRARPDLREEILRPPRAIRAVGPREGQALLDLAREAMLTRARDLDAFANADVRDVRLADCGEGLELACFGPLPERRLLLESLYGFLMIQNGVPVGYTQSSALFGSCEVAFNVFPSFRGGEAARILGRALAAFRELFGVDTFSVEPFQLGHENDEGLGSGAWWFYYKLGFRPAEPDTARLARREEKRAATRRGYRSSETTLRRLVVSHVFLHLGRPRSDVLGRIDLGRIGERISRLLSRRFGDDRERGLEACRREALSRLGLSTRGWSADERHQLERWGPLIALLPGVERWSGDDKRAAARALRAKGGRRESDFVVAFDTASRLRRAVAALGRPAGRR